MKLEKGIGSIFVVQGKVSAQKLRECRDLNSGLLKVKREWNLRAVAPSSKNNIENKCFFLSLSYKF